MKIAVISEELNFPIDEGFKKVAYEIVNVLKDEHKVIFIGKHSIDISGCLCKAIRTNKLFLNKSLFKTLSQFNPEVILYIPYSSITMASLLRAWILKIFLGKRIIILALQPRYYHIFSKYFIPFFRPDLLLVLSKKSEEYYQQLSFKVKKVPLGVDLNRFKPLDKEEKIQLRKKYGIPEDKKVFLHIGHLKKTRNIISFVEAVKKKNVFLLLVISTSTFADRELRKKLHGKNNIKTIDWYIEDIEEIYQLSDCYLFLVEDPIGCIEIPLSVLEAMACNLPVITTRFGGLPDWFREKDGLIFIDKKVDLSQILKNLTNIFPKTRPLVKPLSWNEVSKIIIKQINEKRRYIDEI